MSSSSFSAGSPEPSSRRSFPAWLCSSLFSGLGLFLLGVSLALGFAVSAQSIARAMVSMRQERVIKVKGVAERPVVSTLGTWTGRVSVGAPTLAEGATKLDGDVAKLREFIVAAGFPADAIVLDAVTTSTEYARDERGNATSTIAGYRLGQRVVVRSADVQGVLELSRSATALLRLDIEIDSDTPRFTIADVESIKMALLKDATANGRERAETLANASGGRVGSLRAANQGVFQIVPRGSVEWSDYGVNDTSAIEKSVKAVVTLEFAVAE